MYWFIVYFNLYPVQILSCAASFQRQGRWAYMWNKGNIRRLRACYSGRLTVSRNLLNKIYLFIFSSPWERPGSLIWDCCWCWLARVLCTWSAPCQLSWSVPCDEQLLAFGTLQDPGQSPWKRKTKTLRPKKKHPTIDQLPFVLKAVSCRTLFTSSFPGKYVPRFNKCLLETLEYIKRLAIWSKNVPYSLQ